MAENHTAPVTISDSELKKSAVKYRSKLLMMPVLGLNTSLKHMTPRPGVRGREVLGEMSGDIQLGPYDEKREDKTAVAITPRVLETYLGSVVKKFSPNSVWQTVYGSLLTKGEGLKNVDITLQVLAFLAARLGKNLNKVLWSAKRSEVGTESKDLFTGFDEITKADASAGKITTVLGNKFVIEKITNANAVDVLKGFYRAASDELKEEQTKLYIPTTVYEHYVDDYQTTLGHLPYNTSFDKTFLEGTHGRCELVPMSNKAKSPYIHLTTQSNMLVGFGNGGDEEKILVEKHHAFLLDFIATMFFGVQFETVSKERFLVGTIDDTQAIV